MRFLRARKMAAFGILVILFGMIPTPIFAQTDACSELTDLIEQGAPDFPLLQELKLQCQTELEKGPNVILAKALGGFHMTDELESARIRRSTERVSLSKQIRDHMKPFLEKDPKLILREEDSYFVDKLKYLKNIADRLQVLQKMSLHDYLNPDAQETLRIVQGLPTFKLNLEAIQIQADLKYQEKAYATQSDAEIASLDQKIQTYLESSIGKVNAFKANAVFLASHHAIQDFQNAVSPSVLKLQATTTWGKFMIKSHLNAILLKTDLDISYGFSQSASEKLKSVDQMIQNFLTRLPNNLAQEIQNSIAYKAFRQEYQKRLATLSSLADGQILGRLQNTVHSQADSLAQVQSACETQYPKFLNQIRQLRSDQLNWIEKQKHPQQAFDSDAEKFVAESIGHRSEIVLELCQGFGP